MSCWEHGSYISSFDESNLVCFYLKTHYKPWSPAGNDLSCHKWKERWYRQLSRSGRRVKGNFLTSTANRASTLFVTWFPLNWRELNSKVDRSAESQYTIGMCPQHLETGTLSPLVYADSRSRVSKEHLTVLHLGPPCRPGTRAMCPRPHSYLPGWALQPASASPAFGADVASSHAGCSGHTAPAPGHAHIPEAPAGRRGKR